MDERIQNQEQQNQSESIKQQTQEHQMAENPNPRANENIRQIGFDQEKEQNTNLEDNANQVGSEITDGEDA